MWGGVCTLGGNVWSERLRLGNVWSEKLRLWGVGYVP